MARTIKAPDNLLTPRQAEIVQLVAKGLTARQAALRLGLSPRTIETYLAAARKRMNAASTAELIARTKLRTEELQDR